MTAPPAADDSGFREERTRRFNPYEDYTPEQFLNIAIKNKRRQVREIAAGWEAERTVDTYVAGSSGYTIAFDEEAAMWEKMNAGLMTFAMAFSLLSMRDEYRNALSELSVLTNLHRYARETGDWSVVDKARPLIIMRADIPSKEDFENSELDVRLADDVSSELLDIIQNAESDNELAKRYTFGTASQKFRRAARKIKKGLSEEEVHTVTAISDSGKLFRQGGSEMLQAIHAQIIESSVALSDAFRLANGSLTTERKHFKRVVKSALRDGKDMLTHFPETYREMTSPTTYESHQKRINLNKGRLRRYGTEDHQTRFGELAINERFYPKAEVQLIRALGQREADIRSITRQRGATSGGTACTLAFMGLAFLKGTAGMARGASEIGAGNASKGATMMTIGMLDIMSGYLNVTTAQGLGERSTELQKKDRKYGGAVMKENIRLFEHRFQKIEREKERNGIKSSAEEAETKQAPAMEV